MKSSEAQKRAKGATESPGFSERESDARFLAVLSAASKVPSEEKSSASATQTIIAPSGQQIARVQQAGRDLKVILNRGTNAGFATFLVEQLPSLFETYVETRQSEDHREV